MVCSVPTIPSHCPRRRNPLFTRFQSDPPDSGSGSFRMDPSTPQAMSGDGFHRKVMGLGLYGIHMPLYFQRVFLQPLESFPQIRRLLSVEINRNR